MFDSVPEGVLTDGSLVFLSNLKLIEKWYSLILNPNVIYQFGLKFLLSIMKKLGPPYLILGNF